MLNQKLMLLSFSGPWPCRRGQEKLHLQRSMKDAAAWHDLVDNLADGLSALAGDVSSGCLDEQQPGRQAWLRIQSCRRELERLPH
eukprot:236665-Amphidinium_carterae.1